jgi:hypothetical protein
MHSSQFNVKARYKYTAAVTKRYVIDMFYLHRLRRWICDLSSVKNNRYAIEDLHGQVRDKRLRRYNLL